MSHPFSNWDEVLGQGPTNYDIHIIVVILKVTMIFFQLRPWIIDTIIMVVLGHTCPI